MSGADASPRSETSAREFGSAWAAAENALRAGDLTTARRHATGIADQSRRQGMERRFGRAQRLLGQIAQAGGDVESAERSFRTALSTFTILEDDHTAARVLAEMAALRLRRADFGGATELSRQALKRAPGDVYALTVLGYAQWLGGSPADGATSFERALLVSRNAVPALTGRGQVRADLGDHRAALADLDRALALGVDPQDEADVRSGRALALAGLGRFDEAETEILRALALDSGRPRTRLRRALVRAFSGDADKAHRDLQEVLSLDTTPVENATARRTLARLRPT
jgi:tetratricopeptide (TPR) repeat protein